AIYINQRARKNGQPVASKTRQKAEHGHAPEGTNADIHGRPPCLVILLAVYHLAVKKESLCKKGQGRATQDVPRGTFKPQTSRQKQCSTWNISAKIASRRRPLDTIYRETPRK